jgi:hypothetical protein
MVTSLNFTHFFNGQELYANGSNFITLYLRLRTSLQLNGALYMIIKPLGAPPGVDSNQATANSFRYRRNCYTIAHTAIHNMMVSEMRGFWETAKSNEIINDLKRDL